jgi:hypothetical protein
MQPFENFRKYVETIKECGADGWMDGKIYNRIKR